MLVRFTSKAGPDIVMFKDDAVRLLRMMQHSGTIPSAIRAEAVQTSLSHLERALQEEDRLSIEGQPVGTESAADKTDEDVGDDQPIGIRTRAFPLMQLLKAAISRQAGIMWDYDDSAFF